MNMNHEELDDFLKAWERTWQVPGWRYHLKMLGWIALVVLLLLGMVYACNFLKKNDQNQEVMPDREEEPVFGGDFLKKKRGTSSEILNAK